MSDKFTRIELPGTNYGLLERDDISAEKAIAAFRRYSANLRTEANAIDSASDASFQIDLVSGSIREKFIKTIQQSQPTVSPLTNQEQ